MISPLFVKFVNGPSLAVGVRPSMEAPKPPKMTANDLKKVAEKITEPKPAEPIKYPVIRKGKVVGWEIL